MLEDVPSKTIGGWLMLLTCRVCNNDVGTKLNRMPRSAAVIERVDQSVAVRPAASVDADEPCYRLHDCRDLGCYA